VVRAWEPMTSQTNFGQPSPQRTSMDPLFKDLHVLKPLPLAWWLEARNAQHTGLINHHRVAQVANSATLKKPKGIQNTAFDLTGIRYRCIVVRSHTVWRRCVTRPAGGCRSHVGLI
jgi:hypothetical protein